MTSDQVPVAGPTGTAPRRSDAVVAAGLAVVLGALAGVCALLGGQFLLGVLRLAAGLLAGLAVGALAVAVLGERTDRRDLVRGIAAALALVVAIALTVPALISARVPTLEDAALSRTDPLAEGDSVVSVGTAGAPVLLRRAAGGGQLLHGTRVDAVEGGAEDVLALTADGHRLLRIGADATTVLDLPGTGAPQEAETLPGQVVALAGDLAVARTCTDGTCRLAGHDLAAADPTTPRWQVLDGSAEDPVRGPDADAAELAAPQAPTADDPGPGLLDAIRSTGRVPSVPLRRDAAGWMQLDPRTGFAVGQVLAPADAACRIAATDPAPGESSPVVLTVCAGEDGALTASSFAGGTQQWTSEAGPAGDWSVRLEDGRVIASGEEGEMVASGGQSAWTAPGGEGVAQASAFVTRIGIDGSRMIVTNDQGQVVAYDTATGQNPWSVPADAPADEVRGALATGTLALVTPPRRERALDPRGAERLRVIEAASGRVRVDLTARGRIQGVHPLGDGRVLVDTEDAALLVGG